MNHFTTWSVAGKQGNHERLVDQVDQKTLHRQVSDYRIYESIASGGFGTVYIGR